MKNLLVPYKSQWDQDAGRTNNDCGPASIAMILNYYGERYTTDAIHVLTEAGSGLINFNQMLTAIKKCGYQGERKANQSVDQLKAYIDQDIPVIALVKYGSLDSVQDKNFKGGHFFVVVGYRDDGYFVNDPNFKGDLRGDGDHHFFTKDVFEKAWSDSAKDGNQPNSLLVIYRKVSGTPGDTMQMYKGYDLDNKDSMKIAVDKLVEILDGKYVEKSKLDEVQKQLTECLNRPQNGSNEQFEINGKTETYVQDGKTVTINYAVKR